MPEICRFYSIIIRMYYDDHNPPHFHALYGDDWASMHQDELRHDWELASKQQKPEMKMIRELLYFLLTQAQPMVE